ncbi:response regulator [Leptolyngbya sp. NIES-2104]|uniref:response regulator n=1 Tax=Leptolyngbya sp. NIES-2104 TaxID=1552121 RepID=UPI0006EC9AAD|nr:response regulator [Leptolyngbya sp. NIES-2104]GAP94501.1 signal transduction histidine kinase [Leptolyngbya sp. NIES-2104]
MNTLPLQGLRILLVEDEPDSREMMIVALEAEGAEIVAVENVTSAFTALSGWQPDLLISDIRMPDSDGFTFLQTLRSQSILIPAIAVTGSATDDERKEAFAAGFQRHLPKPIDLDLLYQTITELIPQSTE